MAKGKYSTIIDRLPRLAGVDPERKDAIEAVKQEILTPPLPGNETSDPTEAKALMDELNDAMKTVAILMKRCTAGKPWAAEFARAYANCRAIREQIDEWSRDIGVLVETYQWLMVEQMEVEGVSALTLENGQPVSTFLEPYAQVVDKERFRLWCVEQGLERLMTLPWMTANKLTKDRLLAGDPEPPGVTCWAKTKVRLGSE